MGSFYIHKVGHQEMGSVNKRGERPARGRYFLISKSCLFFFPHISSVVMNDKVIVSIVPMIKGNVRERVLCTMDYHNQKYSDIEYSGKNPRNEVRLYMNQEIDPDKEYFFKGDYAVFEKLEMDGDVFYSLTRITPENKNSYLLQNILDKYDKRFRANAVIDTVFDFIETPVLDEVYDVVVTDEAKKVIKTESDSLLSTYKTQENNDIEENSLEESMGCSIFNSSLFHDLVMNAYQYRCAITGKVIRYKEGNVDLFNLEAAHIKPQAHQGTFLPCNGIALCRDMHFAFDKGFFCISDDYRVKWDAWVISVLDAPDDEGFLNQILCGEEDYGSSDKGAYESSRRVLKASLSMLRLLYPEGLSEKAEKIFSDYIYDHRMGAEAGSESWIAVRDIYPDKKHFDLLQMLECIDDTNRDAMIRQLGDDKQELKSLLVKSSGGEAADRFFSSLEI